MRYIRVVVALCAIVLLCAAAPAAQDKTELSSNAVDLLAVNTDTTAAHENVSNRKTRQFFYSPYGYGGYYGGYGGYYGGYGGYGLYGYRYPGFYGGGYPYYSFYG